MLTINLQYDANAMAAPQSFRDGLQAAANILDAAIHDPVTINIQVGYGEFGLGTSSYQPLTSNYSLGGIAPSVPISYAALRAALLSSESSATDVQSVNALPATATLNGRSTFNISTGLAKVFGAISPTAGTIDGYVGFPASFTGDALLGTALVEELHAMDLANAGGDLGLFAYTSPGVHFLPGGATASTAAYFSLDGGNTSLAPFNVANDDTLFVGQPSDPLDFPNQGTRLTALDLQEIDAIGFDVTTTPTLASPNVTPTITAAGTAATVTGQAATTPENRAITALSLIKSVTAPTGKPVASYGFEDLGGDGGYLTINGVAEPNNSFVYVLASQLNQLQYVGGKAAGSETIEIVPVDGSTYQIGFATVTTTDPAAVITGYFAAILGRTPDAAGLATYVNAVATGTSYAQIEASLAHSAEAQTDIAGIYGAELGRPVDAVAAVNATQFLATGGSLVTLRAQVATSLESQAAVSGIYSAELGRPADAAATANTARFLAAGGSLVTVRALVATTPESEADVAAIYGAELGRPATGTDIANTAQFLAAGGSLVTERALVATSQESEAAGSAIYQAELGRAADGAATASTAQFLAAGGSLVTLRALVATSPESQAAVSAIFQAELGRPADAVGTANFARFLAAGGSLTGIKGVVATSNEAQNAIASQYFSVLSRSPDNAGLSAGTTSLASTGSLAAVRSALANSAEARTDVTALLQGDTGSAPSANAVAAGQTQLADGLSLIDLNAQTLNLAASPTMFLGLSGGTTIAPSTGGAVFGFATGSFGQNTIVGFNTAKDVLQLNQSQFPTLGAVRADTTQTAGGAVITLDANNSIALRGVTAASLVPADFRFV